MPNKRKRKDDFLAASGMTPEQQFAATMRAAAVPVSDFEGDNYIPPGTYRDDTVLARVLWEASMRRRTGIPKEGTDNGNEEK